LITIQSVEQEALAVQENKCTNILKKQ